MSTSYPPTEGGAEKAAVWNGDSGPHSTVEPESDAPHLVPNATVTTTAINIICNILGGALLVLPLAFEEMSVIPAIIITALMGVLSIIAIYFMIVPAEKYQCFTYKDLLTRAFSPLAGKLFDVVLFLYTYGVLIEFAKIVAQAMPPAAENFASGKRGIYSHEWFWLLLSFLPFFIFSSMKQLSNLRWTSYLGIATIYYVVVFVVTRFFIGNYSDDPSGGLVSTNIRWVAFDLGFAKGIPILSVCFSCHYNIPSYYGELQNRSLKKFGKAVSIAFPLILVTYVTVGVLGYLMFGTERVIHSKGNIMTAFSNTDVPSTIGQLGLFVHFCTVFPIVALGCRRCLNQLLFGSPWQQTYRYVIEAFFLVTTASLLAYFASGVGIVVEIIGALFAISIVFIIPSAIYIKLGGPRGPPPVPQQQAENECTTTNASAVETSALLPAHADADVDGASGVGADGVISAAADRRLVVVAWCSIVGGLIASLSSFVITLIKIA